MADQGIGAVLLFGHAERKDARGSEAYAAHGIVQRAVRAIKAAAPSLLTITDVCLCAYTSHGHCGVLSADAKPAANGHGRRVAAGPRVVIDNDATLELLAKVAVSHAEAGADMVAPSDMMDGNVAAVRRGLDRAGFEQVSILAYSVKFASALYAPFRQAVDSAPQRGDRRSYQMDIANGDEAVREARLDIEQGADIVMVKPALSAMDIIYRLKHELRHPVAAFNVSGEYAMVKAAAARGWLDEQATWLELLTGLKRAGADMIITYWAKDAAAYLSSPHARAR
jgi:porphobilinogen synthase